MRPEDIVHFSPQLAKNFTELRHLAECTPSTAWTLDFPPTFLTSRWHISVRTALKLEEEQSLTHILILQICLGSKSWMAWTTSKVIRTSIKQSTRFKSVLEKNKTETEKKPQRYLSMQGIVFSEDHCLHAGHFCTPNHLDTSLLSGLTS